ERDVRAAVPEPRRLRRPTTDGSRRSTPRRRLRPPAGRWLWRRRPWLLASCVDASVATTAPRALLGAPARSSRRARGRLVGRPAGLGLHPHRLWWGRSRCV